ncbi:MAG: metal-dependent hydrolase [Phycisphaerae bacterium]|jgi:membrane-bound metal-dependent hydrolase YbcI (DUF457 family)
MLFRTHVAISVLFILLLIPYVNNQIIFSVVFLIATFIPDIDTAYSKVGKYKIFRPLQFFVEHRGLIHSFTFLILLTLAFVFVYPVVALPLFLGFGIHLIFDSFTIDGIRPFYPYSRTISGKMKTGGKVELFIFFLTLILIIFVLLFKYTGIF